MINIRRCLRMLGSSAQSSRRRKANHRWTAGLETFEARELLTADATVIKNINAGSASGLPAPETSFQSLSPELNGYVYFNANDGTHGFELWRTNGTEANTQLFADLTPGSQGAYPHNFVVANGKLFFTSSGIYVSDGTTDGTAKLMYSEKAAYAIGTVDGIAYFYFADRPIGNSESPGGTFWKTDGTVEGTVAFAYWDKPGPPEFSTVFENTMFFLGGFGELYKIDPATSTLVAVSGSPSGISGLTATAIDLFFPTNGLGGDGQLLWVLDSATGTPKEVQSPQSASIALHPENLCAVKNILYFSGFTTANGHELWRSDGTSAGTYLVKDIQPGTASSRPANLAAVDETLFFGADDGTHGVELWKSNGAEPDTVLVKDIFPGPNSSFPRALFDLNGQLIFNARTDLTQNGSRMWTSNGTEAGTMEYGTLPSLPGPWRHLGYSVIFAGENSTVGRELFIDRFGEPPVAPVITGPNAITPSLRPTVTWNAVGSIIEYDIWIKNQSTHQDRFIVQSASGTAFTPSFDLGIGNFTVWVRTAGTADALPSLWSAQYNFRINTPVTQNPVAPNPANGFPMISWQMLPGAEKYDVWIDRLDVPTSQIVRNTNVTVTSLTPTSLPRGQYRAWVRGFAADGADGAWSAPQDFSSEQVPVITAVLNPTFDTTPTVSWTAVPSAASYEVYVRSINGNFKALHQKGINGTSFTWPSLPPGPYEYWVRVTGSTVWSNSVFLNTDGRTNVLAPTGSTTNRRPVISWRPVDLAVRYELWVDQLGVQQKIIYQTNLTTTSYTPPSNLPLGNYRAWVRAVSAKNELSPWSVPVDFTVATIAASQDALLRNQAADELLSGVLVSVFHKSESARTVLHGDL